MDESISQYLDQISLSFPVQNEYAEKYLSTLETSIQDYVADHPDATFLDIERRIGIPQEIVSDYLSAINPEKLLADNQQEQESILFKQRRRHFRILVGLLSMFLVVFIGFYVAALIQFNRCAIPVREVVTTQGTYIKTP